MAPRKSNDSDKDKADYTSENEADVSNSNNEEGSESENEPIKKSGKTSNGKESSVDKNGKDDDTAEGDDQDDDEENGNDDEDRDENANESDYEEQDDEAPNKKRKVGKGKAKPAGKKKKVPTAKATPKKKKAAAAKKPDEEENGEEEYEVKDVIDSKKEKNVTYYLIRWKGYTAADDTWERATDLSCNDLIAAFNKKNQNKKSAPVAKQPPKKRKNDEEVDPEKEYEVEKIISMLENKKGKVFRIRWKGFRSTQDTWEPEENLNCKDLIEKFLVKHKEQSQYSSKSLREDPKRTKRLVNETKNPRARSSKRSSAKARKTYYSEDDDSE